MESVRTPKFFLTYKSTDWHAIAVLENNFGVLPRDYKQFLAECGGGKFVRQWSRDLYEFRIFSNPRMASFDPLEVCIVAESEGGSLLGFRPKQSNKVIEFNRAKETEWDLPISEVFKCQIQDRLRKYGKRRLDDIVRGPEPFTESEVKIVEALRMYRIEAEPTGEHLEFKIQNGSSMELDHITLGAIVIRQRAGVDGRSISYGVDGRLYLDVSGILPGQSVTRFQACYPSIADPKDIQIYRLYPGPEDRRYFKEFPEQFQFGK